MKPLTAPFPRVVGWAWVGIAALLLLDLAVHGQDRYTIVAAAVLLVTVGGDYVLWLRPRVVPTWRGVRVINPLRETFVPWSVFTWADVTDVLRVHAGDRIIRSWPLRETKRAKVRDNLRRAHGYADPADEDPRDMRPVDYAAKQLRDEAERRKGQVTSVGGYPGDVGGSEALATGPVTVWSPDALVALGVPVVLLLAVALLI